MKWYFSHMFSKWFWSERRKARKQKRARITQLNNSIAEVWKSVFRNAKTQDEWQAANQIASDLTRYDRNELDSLLQSRLQAKATKIGLIIPKEYESDEWPMKPTLSYEGEAWVNRELRKLRKENFKSWTEIIVPILALLVALASVLKK